MEGETFQPCPRWGAGLARVPSVAMPALPFSPVKFSALIERVLACDSREMLCSPIPRPLKDVMWAALLLCGRVFANFFRIRDRIRDWFPGYLPYSPGYQGHTAQSKIQNLKSKII